MAVRPAHSASKVMTLGTRVRTGIALESAGGGQANGSGSNGWKDHWLEYSRCGGCAISAAERRRQR